MNWARRIALSMVLLMVVMFAFKANQSLDNFIKTDKKPSYSSINIPCLAFIQPQNVTVPYILPHKISNCFVLKYLQHFLVVIPDFKIKILFSRFSNQDINRCEMVSLLLFPYHSFW